MNEDFLSGSEEDAENDLEDFIRGAAPRQLPVELRAGILRGMDEDSVPAGKVIGFPRRLAAVAAAIILGAFMLVTALSHRSPEVAAVAPSGPGKLSSPPAVFAPVAVSTSEVGSQPVGPMLDVNGHPVRLVKSYELATHAYEEPSTGAIVKVSYPQTRYQFVNAPIQ